MLQSSFLNQYLFNDTFVKSANLDIIFLQTNPASNTPQLLHSAFLYDTSTSLSILGFPLSPLLSTEYQDVTSTLLSITPELTTTLVSYVEAYIFLPSLNNLPTAVFDFYVNNSNFFYGEGCVFFFLYFLYAFFLVYVFMTSSLLRWQNFYGAHFLRFYYYFYSLSKETRIQFEAVTQTMIFFLIYWGMVIMAFDDDQEEVIEFIDTSFFNFLTLIILYLCYKYSIHYFAFLEASVAEGRTVVYVATQFFKDFLNTFSLMLRFYVLVLRINIYDIFDDILDSYYVFIIDFDDDEYLNELFLSIHGTLFFTNDNHDDRSFLLEDESGFASDLFYLYFLVWGKINFFLVFLVEEAARLALGFYICFLIIFEMHSVSCSYKEDLYFSNMRS